MNFAESSAELVMKNFENSHTNIQSWKVNRKLKSPQHVFDKNAFKKIAQLQKKFFILFVSGFSWQLFKCLDLFSAGPVDINFISEIFN